MLGLEWRPRADLDRQSIALYLGMERGNPQAALHTIQEIDQAIDRARAFPESGRLFQAEGLEHRDYRSVLAGSHRVFYRHDGQTLTVCRIVHQRQDIDTYALVDLP